MASERSIVIGAGQAGMQIVEALRRGGFAGDICLLGEEAWLPYQRPPLSKKFLTGEVDEGRLYFRPAAQYDKLDIRVMLGAQVGAIDRASKTVRLASGERLAYDRLALATGARVRPLPVPGADDARVCYLRGLDDARRIKAGLTRTARVTVIGGGFIGLEVASIARGLGKAVCVLEAQDRLMPRVVAPVVSAFFEALHREQGVRVQTGAEVTALAPAGGALAVLLADGGPVETDLVIVGIGVVPNVELAAVAGLACDGGILVDEYARTADPAIVAAGDCTRHRNTLYPEPHRLESVQNAVDQAKIAAASMLGRETPYTQIPWFWSDQYDIKLQMAGLSQGYDALCVRGVPASRAFSVFYFRNERLIAVDSINKPAEHMLARRLLAGQCAVTPVQASDVDCDLKALLPAGT